MLVDVQDGKTLEGALDTLAQMTEVDVILE